MIERAELETIVHRELSALAPEYLRQRLTDGVINEMRGRLVRQVERQVDAPFELQIRHDGYGGLTISADPKMTVDEEAAREREIVRLAEQSRLAQIEADKLRSAASASRAEVRQEGTQAFVSIPGMIKDLRDWRAPPDIFNECHAGFQRGIEDVIHYLTVREKEGGSK